MYAAIFILMYALCLRIGEVVTSGHSLHAIKIRNVSSHLNGYLIKLESFKWATTPMMFFLQPKNNALCPVRALSDYLRIRKPGDYLFMDESANLVNRVQVSKVLAKAIREMGLNPSDYNTHSLRKGRASDMCMNNISKERIGLIGRWHSNAYKAYFVPDCITI